MVKIIPDCFRWEASAENIHRANPKAIGSEENMQGKNIRLLSVGSISGKRSTALIPKQQTICSLFKNYKKNSKKRGSDKWQGAAVRCKLVGSLVILTSTTRLPTTTNLKKGNKTPSESQTFPFFDKMLDASQWEV